MRHIDTTRLIHIGLRGLTLCSKFLFVFFLAKFLPARDVGLYGLLAATVGYGIYLVGLEFYTYSARELMSASEDGKPFILRNQLTVYLGWYVIAAVVLALLVQLRVVPEDYGWWIGALLLCEHLAQEFNRILIALSKPLVAGVVLFVRLGLWSLIVAAVQWQIPEARTIDVVLCGWLAGSACACVLAVYQLRGLIVLCPKAPIDMAWIRCGLRAALPLFAASIAVRGLATFDRFFIDAAGGLDVVAAYVIFIGMASAVLAFIDAGVIDFSVPKLVAAARGGNISVFHTEFERLRKAILGLGLVLIVGCGMVGWLFIDLLGSPVYEKNLYLLYWVLSFTAINVLSLVPHLGLYALGRDRAIVGSQVAGFCVFLLVYAGSRSFGSTGVMVAMCAAWTCILVWKSVAYRRAVFKAIN